MAYFSGYAGVERAASFLGEGPVTDDLRAAGRQRAKLDIAHKISDGQDAAAVEASLSSPQSATAAVLSDYSRPICVDGSNLARAVGQCPQNPVYDALNDLRPVCSRPN